MNRKVRMKSFWIALCASAVAICPVMATETEEDILTPREAANELGEEELSQMLSYAGDGTIQGSVVPGHFVQ
jgi:hypothetical protein